MPCLASPALISSSLRRPKHRSLLESSTKPGYLSSFVDFVAAPCACSVKIPSRIYLQLLPHLDFVLSYSHLRRYPSWPFRATPTLISNPQTDPTHSFAPSPSLIPIHSYPPTCLSSIQIAQNQLLDLTCNHDHPRQRRRTDSETPTTPRLPPHRTCPRSHPPPPSRPGPHSARLRDLTGPTSARI